MESLRSMGLMQANERAAREYNELQDMPETPTLNTPSQQTQRTTSTANSCFNKCFSDCVPAVLAGSFRDEILPALGLSRACLTFVLKNILTTYQQHEQHGLMRVNGDPSWLENVRRVQAERVVVAIDWSVWEAVLRPGGDNGPGIGSTIGSASTSSATGGDSQLFVQIAHAFYSAPELTLRCFSMAVLELLGPALESRITKLAVQVVNWSRRIALKKIKANYLDHLILAHGTVVRCGNTRPECVSMAFVCLSCGGCFNLIQRDGRMSMPVRCQTDRCRGKAFVPDPSRAITITQQTIRIQEDADSKDPGRMPRQLECTLKHELVDICAPGDVVNVCGIVRNTDVGIADRTAMAQARGGSEKTAKKNVRILFLEALSVDRVQQQNQQARSRSANGSAGGSLGNRRGGTLTSSVAESNDPLEGGGEDLKGEMSFTHQELDVIRNTAERYSSYSTASPRPKPYALLSLLVDSLCPEIFGHEAVKLGMLLAICGGRVRRTETGMSVRADIHMLVVGDPGMGKSQMLLAANRVAPRGAYVCGTNSTATGLTVSLQRDGNDMALEAGALVLSDQGCCCIDEFDKMPKEHSLLLEAMEQQSVSIAKAGAVVSLPARASVIAAANPASGHYNPAKSVGENVRLNPALLSRFDLIFVLRDSPESGHDRHLSDHVMLSHRISLEQESLSAARTADDRAAARKRLNELKNRAKVALSERHNTAGTNDVEDDMLRALARSPHAEGVANAAVLGTKSLRRWLAYARQYVQPRLTLEAADVLSQFYVKLRSSTRIGGALSGGSNAKCSGPPITTRQLESLVRLAEARARLELREEVTAGDARDVVCLMQQTLWALCADEYGFVDMRTDALSNTQPTASQTRSAKERSGKRLVSILAGIHASDPSRGRLFKRQEIFDIFVQQCGGAVTEFASVVDWLNHQGFILNKGSNYELRLDGVY